MARLVGRKADGWLPSLFLMGIDVAQQRIAEIREAAGAAGRDPDDLVYACNVRVLVDPSARSGRGVIAGSAEAVAAELVRLVACGFTLLNLWPGGEGREQRERLAQDVIPAVRKALA
jgi:alkanesulfonate monooxygenase SsuD/methylene tetrahydromethanopterin reductase-like flavin-dependent oxidoreductase (luciferase family)